VCFVIISISCKDKPDPKPTSTVNINDILGTWVSVDSNIIRSDNGFIYSHDVLFVGKDTLVGGLQYSIYVETRPGYAFYSAKYFGSDSLVLSYRGPFFILTPDYMNKVFFNRNKDTMTIFDFRTTYPGRFCNEFYKQNK
jgi:hypothetical protein